MADWVGELSPRVSVLAASSSLPLLVGRFRCGPRDPAWREVNRIGDVAYVVFPRTPVAITPVGATTLAADANRVLLYDAGQEYLRAPLDPRGDDSVFLALGPETVDEISRTASFVDPRRGRFTVRQTPCPADIYATLQSLRARPPATFDDQLETDELLLGILHRVLDHDVARSDEQAMTLAEAVRTILARRYREGLTLDEIAAEVGLSPYHLHRRFRAATGWTVHAYRDQLRLREGLARVLDGEVDLAAVACDLGYSSHSHFTARFRRAFGVTPSSARHSGRAPGRAARS